MFTIQCKRDALLVPLQSVSGIVERRHTLPILSNVLLERVGSDLTLLATDIEIQITTSQGNFEGGHDGSLTVSAKKLLDILRSLPESADITLAQDEKRLQLKAGKSRFNLQTLPAQDFPLMVLNEGDTQSIQVTQQQFKQLIAKTQYAMAAQDVRYYLNGLLLMVEGNELRAVATDGHRLAFASQALDGDYPRMEMIVPRKTILELNRLLGDNADPLMIDMTANQLKFKFANVNLVTKLIDGKFPDYQRVIPTLLKNELSVNRMQLMQAMQRVAILTNEKFRGVRLLLTDNSLKIVAANAEQEEAQEEIEVSYNGDTLDVGFNVGYLLDVLNNIQTEDVLWSFNDANSSSLITIPGNSQFKYVVMPMRI
ncbi:MAG: hypothetical protein RIR18_1545 [Pseudomonadota bacterium]|jgi:DNA polymerase-3 subunit beta